MRKIEKEVIGAFLDRTPKRLGNTESVCNPMNGDYKLLLYGNCIATLSNRLVQSKVGDGYLSGHEFYVNDMLWVSNCGWPTRTTQSRLNALFRLIGISDRVFTKHGEQYLDSSRHGVVNLTALRGSSILAHVYGEPSV